MKCENQISVKWFIIMLPSGKMTTENVMKEVK